MTSNICLSQSASFPVDIDTDTCTTIAWLDLVASAVDNFDGDDWLALCGDIDEGEIYRDWFIWQDVDFSQEWEAYDLTTNKRFVATDLSLLKAHIDRIEDARSAISITESNN
ncbi:MAG: hypothetical protein F6K54_09110 [Okeania sp. SIO3B5]|uniref:hypothetical protein n=1 Tax=Okeania sp. SIO3B5 TaxID=2607811 RepID=UPI0013FF395A|nr:hypothetical protein [Okeania sp. SIO3B5]NEO53223.1 hypothetical protein [Okeania sp. SIO3B5]